MSWQIVPVVFGETMLDKDAEKSERVMKALMQMHEIDIENSKEAYAQR